jgi:electron transfer flavoprotein alpha subunit
MILGLVEHAEGRPDRLSLEMLTLAGRLGAATGEPIHAVLVGPGARDAAGQLAGRGVATAHVVESDRLDAFAPGAWAAAIEQLMSAHGPSIVLAAGSDRGNEVMAHLGARTGLPLAANCTDVVPGESGGSGQPLRLTRQRWAGSLLEDALLDAPTKLLTIAPHAVAIEEAAAAGATPAIGSFDPALSDDDLRVAVARRLEPDRSGVSLTDARVVVGGGRGVGGPDAFSELEELAALLGGAVGVSRVVTSSGWRPHSQQIGQTGLRIAPDLYIACGISGAIQHIVGAKAAKRILAINTDPDAPIMTVADYAVIGDLHQVVPAISAEIRRVTGR